mgnify:FL=1
MEAVRKENIIPLKGLKKDMPFGQWMDFWYQYYTKNTVRETTQATYEGEIYKHIIPEVGKIPLNKLTQADLQKFYADQLTPILLPYISQRDDIEKGRSKNASAFLSFGVF